MGRIVYNSPSNNAGNNAGNPAGAPLGGGRTSVKPSAADSPRRGPASFAQGRQTRPEGVLGPGGQQGRGAATATENTQPGNQTDNTPEIQAGPGGGVGADRTARGGGATGIVEKVEDGTLTIRTAEGPVTVITSEDTRIAALSPAEISGLTVGATAVAIGRRDADGVAATALIVNPSGLDIPLLGSPARNRRGNQYEQDAPDGGGADANGGRGDNRRGGSP